MDSCKYIRMHQRILNNRELYTNIPNITIMKDQKELFELIDMAHQNNLIGKETVEFLKADHPKIPVFFYTP